ncbi:MAG: nuclear transport factor 2 family protein, partial [Synergistaceae bacterium]|nr:nuclear transport factor 2 family protein [Synergistaceae bacterium]
MNNFLILGAIISVFMFPLQSLAGEREELQEIYSDMYRYMIAKDVSQLGNLLDDSFILVHMTGMKQTKKEYLTSIQNGTLNYFS